jgi:hypothetical protein
MFLYTYNIYWVAWIFRVQFTCHIIKVKLTCSFKNIQANVKKLDSSDKMDKFMERHKLPKLT